MLIDYQHVLMIGVPFSYTLISSILYYVGDMDRVSYKTNFYALPKYGQRSSFVFAFFFFKFFSSFS